MSNNNRLVTDVVIIGATPAGLACARVMLASPTKAVRHVTVLECKSQAEWNERHRHERAGCPDLDVAHDIACVPTFIAPVTTEVVEDAKRDVIVRGMRILFSAYAFEVKRVVHKRSQPQRQVLRTAVTAITNPGTLDRQILTTVVARRAVVVATDHFWATQHFMVMDTRRSHPEVGVCISGPAHDPFWDTCASARTLMFGGAGEWRLALLSVVVGAKLEVGGIYARTWDDTDDYDQETHGMIRHMRCVRAGGNENVVVCTVQWIGLGVPPRWTPDVDVMGETAFTFTALHYTELEQAIPQMGAFYFANLIAGMHAACSEWPAFAQFLGRDTTHCSGPYVENVIGRPPCACGGGDSSVDAWKVMHNLYATGSACGLRDVRRRVASGHACALAVCKSLSSS